MTTQNKQTEQSLIAQCIAGNRQAQQKLYGQYAGAMYHTSARIVGRREDAEDVLQESFVKVFGNLKHYNKEKSFAAWIKRIVVNQSIDFVRKKKLYLLEEVETEDSTTNEAIITSAENMTVTRVKEALVAIPQRYGAIISLYLLEGYDHEEIAEILGISISNAKTTYHRAKKHLAQKLNDTTWTI